MSAQRHLFGIRIDALRMPEAVSQVLGWCGVDQSRCRYVVTPNVDHTVLLQENEALRAAYADADLVLADGHPLVWASRWLRQPLPERVPGSDLVPRLFDGAAMDRPLRVFLLGAAPGVALRAAENMRQRWPQVETVGVYSPPLGFEKSETESNLILGRILLARPDVLVVGLGAPKQEIWVHQHRDRIHAKVALCVGATIDFLAGEKRRAPRWMQRTGVEWLHRMMSEPKRMVRRYAKDAWVFPQLVWQQWTGRAFRA
jgi:N-acetylglucosaminyldiphosphoundecaprenol N-acetyl-beta-D-mannosaminyltransferase